MIRETIKSIENKIRGAASISGNKKKELLTLLDALQTEIEQLSETQHEESESITRFTEASAHEALKAKKNKQLTDIALNGLKKSIEEFETSHPELTKTINQICSTLASLGI